MGIKHTVNVAAVLLSASIAPAALAAADVTLRVDDTRAQPGAIAAVEVRTYAPRGMEQGEICVTVGGGDKATMIGTLQGHQPRVKTATSPFVALEAVAVFSAAGDATSDAVFDAESQMALVRFSSSSATVNESDGPLAIFYFRVSDAVSDRDVFSVDIDHAGTYLIDAGGETVEIEPRGGRLEIRSDKARLNVD